MTALEIGANAMVTVSIVLAARNHVHTWWTGIVGCALFMLLFRDARLYADATLQVFFIATSAWGWLRWQRGAGPGRELPVQHSSPRLLLAAAGFAAVVTAAYGGLLHLWTDAYAPFVDSAVLACSVVAQWLLVHRRVETWPAWLLVNTLAVPLFASRGLLLTAVLYAAYWCNAWIGWRRWHRLAQAPAAGAP